YSFFISSLHRLSYFTFFPYTTLFRSTLLIGVVAIVIATAEITIIVSIVIYIYEFLVQVSVPIVLGLFWKRGNVYGAFSGMIAGRSEEHTSNSSHVSISYSVFCLKKKI